MRIIRYDDAGTARWGVIEAGGTVRAAAGDPYTALVPGDPVGGDVRLLAPVTPSKILCVGRNYADHAAEFGNPVPKEPLIFLKPPSSIAGPGDAVVYPSLSGRLDPEAELVVVIGRAGRRIRPEDAMSVVFGYTIGNDVTARDIQKSDPQWTRGKGFDTFCPLGPWVDTGFDPSDVRVTCTVNGELRQDGRTRDFIFGIPELIAYVSAFSTLEPGDVIMTGTPPGVRPVQPGDTMTVAVEGLGELSNPVVAEEP
ncbi:2-keto-4-pentenoate hydratase/2-oxohepta-3-ene-1,7-dioic acid hydratase in catechol pathway [Nonomuraea thailandensis]|uniref:2-keto-4-pentenoate hydratase/2-oxohepta-3-ene-1,7-dioic acid hydratase in catechol pathway n=1 Tax=Nonomuraea thailandensis TaxID=1188745 RepID=A0A9X2K4A9_9ACTN|nr:fumarylacetoacetate hydrolase family protein [Nonomuraea thailandensis]MCP2360292.1 2-keto-4-pentenoate hydratase/2-oxohepta-3-ene-1,7-dioic acid hydratase in catechol pathway [Nonomuraea thailandensis]